LLSKLTTATLSSAQYISDDYNKMVPIQTNLSSDDIVLCVCKFSLCMPLAFHPTKHSMIYQNENSALDDWNW
jgi:hypothetical protein